MRFGIGGADCGDDFLSIFNFIAQFTDQIINSKKCRLVNSEFEIIGNNAIITHFGDQKAYSIFAFKEKYVL